MEAKMAAETTKVKKMDDNGAAKEKENAKRSHAGLGDGKRQ